MKKKEHKQKEIVRLVCLLPPGHARTWDEVERFMLPHISGAVCWLCHRARAGVPFQLSGFPVGCGLLMFQSSDSTPPFMISLIYTGDGFEVTSSLPQECVFLVPYDVDALCWLPRNFLVWRNGPTWSAPKLIFASTRNGSMQQLCEAVLASWLLFQVRS